MLIPTSPGTIILAALAAPAQSAGNAAGDTFDSVPAIPACDGLGRMTMYPQAMQTRRLQRMTRRPACVDSPSQAPFDRIKPA